MQLSKEFYLELLEAPNSLQEGPRALLDLPLQATAGGMVVSGQRSQAEKPTRTPRPRSLASPKARSFGAPSGPDGCEGGAPRPSSPRHSRSDPLFPPRFLVTRATRAAEGKRCAIRGRPGTGAGARAVPGSRGAPGGSSARPGRRPGVSPEPGARRPPEVHVQISGGFAASFPLLLSARESCGSGASTWARTTLLSGGGGNAPGHPPLWSPRLTFCPWPLCTARPRACPDQSTPGCRPGELPSFPLLGSPIPFWKHTGRGSFGPREGFSVPKGPAPHLPRSPASPVHLVLISAQGEIWPGA